MTLTTNQLYYGTETPPSQPAMLKAGAVTVRYENGDIRYISVGGAEVLRRVYAAVRDHNWGTVPFRIKNEHIEQNADGFRVQYDADCQQPGLDFDVSCTITGDASGTITFTFDGKARTNFKRNRIGFCVLHQMDLAGQACEIEYVDGSTENGTFPQLIAPHQPYFNLRAITHEVLPGLKAEVRMEGDTFEMEDQRNWTDASYKTYCTPLSLPFPAEVSQGDTVSQKVTITLHGDAPEVVGAAASLTATFGERTTQMPHIGLSMASHGEPLSEQAAQRLRAMNPAHLRVDLRTDDPDMAALLQRAADEASAIACSLELVLHLGDNPDAEVAALRGLLDRIAPPLAWIAVFKRGEKSTTGAWVQQVREGLQGVTDVPIGGGTDAFFTELNRERPDVSVMDFVTYSVNPQVHAFDNIDLAETLAAQAPTVETARSFSEGKPVHVSPVTLKMRWNPNATGEASQTPPGELPVQVDPRQMSLFGAGWTLGSLKALAESGVTSVTYYETTGWLGVMATEDGSPLPEQFADIAGGVYPVYHVLADLGAFAGGEVLVSQSSQPLKVEVMAVKLANGMMRVLLANLTGNEQEIALPDITSETVVKMLDVTNAEHAMREPEAFRAETGTTTPPQPGGFRLTLPPYAVARVDF